MQLTPQLAPAWAQLVRPSGPELLLGRLERGELDLPLHRVSTREEQIVAAVTVSPLGEGAAILSPIVATEDATEAEVALAVREALLVAVERGFGALEHRRLVEQADPRIEEALLEAGFLFRGGRVEFRTPLRVVELVEDSPIAWKGADILGWELAVEMLERVAEGDAHYTPRRGHEEELKSWLSDSVLCGGHECIQIGFLDEEPVGLVIGQVNPQTAWSRITYMGLVPEVRGLGLGRWVHQQGFRLLLALGGELYHGGTASNNTAMRRLFEAHGCEPYRELLEYQYGG